MALFLVVTGLLAVTDDGDFVVAAFFEDFARDLCAGNTGHADFHISAIGGKEDIFKGNLRADAFMTLQSFHKNDVPVFDEVLFRAGLDNREFGHGEKYTVFALKSKKCYFQVRTNYTRIQSMQLQPPLRHRKRADKPMGPMQYLVIKTVAKLMPNAYGMEVIEQVDNQLESVTDSGQIYVTLDRLVGKGYLKSYEMPSPRKTGHTVSGYIITPNGGVAMAIADKFYGLLGRLASETNVAVTD